VGERVALGVASSKSSTSGVEVSGSVVGITSSVAGVGVGSSIGTGVSSGAGVSTASAVCVTSCAMTLYGIARGSNTLTNKLNNAIPGSKNLLILFIIEREFTFLIYKSYKKNVRILEDISKVIYFDPLDTFG